VQELLRHANISVTMNVYAQGVTDLGDHPKAAIDDQVKSGHREKA